jgi:class 3 adenylate cyclase
MTDAKQPNDPLEAGRAAHATHAWHEAYDLLSSADARAPLGAEDLRRLTEAAWWTSRPDETIAAAERAFAVSSASGDMPLAALTALDLAAYHGHQLASSISRGWTSRAERLLQDAPDCAAHGYLTRSRSNRMLDDGRLDEALEEACRTLEIGTRLADRDLQAIGLHQQGIILVAQGKVDEGLALLEEAAVPAVSGELSPAATATIYCNVISTCRDLADYRRAGEWTEAAKRWCERQAISGFPGHCRVYRAEIMRLRGAWAEAEEEVRRACEELGPWSPMFTGEGFNELGEIRLRIGDYASAREAFRMAEDLGATPQPGLAMLDHAEGNIAAATAGVKGALDESTWDRLRRARLLPVRAMLALASGDIASARDAADELEAIAEAFQSSAITASAGCVRGAVQLAEGDPASATNTLRRALRLWQEVEAPYEAAECRVILARAYLAGGDEEGAARELRTARFAFERLGAVPSAERAATLLPSESGQSGVSATRRDTRTFMFTDIVRSTDLVEAMGDEAWEHLLSWHDQTLREAFGAHSGEEIKHQGDGFFVAFPDSGAAVECAVAIQRRLADQRRQHGFAPGVRIGLHAAEATRRGGDYGGRGVHAAARIGALAVSGEVLISLESYDAGPEPYPLSDEREVTLKGITKPVRIASIAWR